MNETEKSEFVDGLHVPTVRAMLDLLMVDGSDAGFYYNPPNDYGVIHFTWHSGKGDPRKRFAGQAQTSKYMLRDGSTEVRPNGNYQLNDKAVKAMIKDIKKMHKREKKVK